MFETLQETIAKTDEQLESASPIQPDIERLLQNVKQQFSQFHLEIGVDRATFNCNFDCQLLLDQLSEGLKEEDWPDFVLKTRDLLQKMLQCVTRISQKKQRSDTASSATMAYGEHELNASSSPRVALSERAQKLTPLPKSAVNQATEIIHLEQNLIHQLKAAHEEMHHALTQAELAEKQAAHDANTALDLARAVSEHTNALEDCALRERQARVKLSDTARIQGALSARLGLVDQLKQDLFSSENRIFNAAQELSSGLEILNLPVERLAAKHQAQVLDHLEQIYQVQHNVEQARLLAQWGEQRLQTLNKNLVALIAQLQTEQSQTQVALQEAQALVDSAMQAYLQAQQALSQHQVKVNEANEQAALAGQNARSMRVKAQEAVLKQQQLAAERAEVADRARFLAQEAADAERTRILTELLARDPAESPS